MDATPSYLSRYERSADDPVAIGLAALGWLCADPSRLDRFLAITGIAPAELRARAADPDLLAAVLAFLEAHEPDLIACADAVGLAPKTMTGARAELERA